MDTRAVATAIGTTPFTLRKFLRASTSTYRPVGSGSRYDFKENEIPELLRRFSEWNGTKATRPVTSYVPEQSAEASLTQAEIDAQVWAEEEAARAADGLGPIKLADLRNPRERRRLLLAARERERRLTERLIAVGLHISQPYQRERRAS